MIAAPAAPAHQYTPTVIPRAERYIRFHGKEILRGTGFLAGKVIKCPDGHVMNQSAVHFEDGLLRCLTRPGRGQAACDALIYLCVFPGRGERRRIWLADCTHQEWREIERLGLDADGVLAYFGASFGR